MIFLLCYAQKMIDILKYLCYNSLIHYKTYRGYCKMKKNGILNSDISRVLSYMGHTDTIAVGDCGLPIPDETERIDLALDFGVPTFMQTLKVISDDMKIEKIILADEIKEHNPDILNQVLELFKDQNIEISFTSHTQLKTLTKSCKAVIRTGETTPYANIILQAGCIF